MVYLKLLLTALFWGGTFVAGRIVSRDMGPFEAAFWRFALASVCMLVFTWRLEGRFPRLDWRRLPGVCFLGLTGVLSYNAFFFLGLQTVDAGRAAVIVALNPIAIAVLAALFLGEGMSKVRALGILLSVSGAALAISRGAPWELLRGAITWGDAAIFGCVASWVAYSLAGKKVMGKLTPPAAVTWSCVTGTLFLAVPAGARGAFHAVTAHPGAVWLSIVYLGFFGTVLGFTWYYQGVNLIGASRASIFINFVPVSAILLGWLLLGERLHPSLLAGGVMVSLGVYLANRPTRDRAGQRVSRVVSHRPKDVPDGREG